MREVLGSSPGRAMCFFSCDIRWPVWGSVLGLRAAKGLSHRYQHGSEQFRGRIYLSREKMSQVECSHNMREVLGLIPGRAKCLFLPCDIYLKIFTKAKDTVNVYGLS